METFCGKLSLVRNNFQSTPCFHRLDSRYHRKRRFSNERSGEESRMEEEEEEEGVIGQINRTDGRATLLSPNTPEGR